jgi:hypothetical protein
MRRRDDASILKDSDCQRTLSSLIRSAVSNNVNLLISDTIPSIFGLETAAASVDCHLLDVVRRSVEVHWRVLREYDVRAARIQQRAVLWYGRDMVNDDQWMDVVVLSKLR